MTKQNMFAEPFSVIETGSEYEEPETIFVTSLYFSKTT